MAKRPVVSFNMWLTLQHSGPFAELAKAWVVTRGRLTADTVAGRAAEVGRTAEEGYAAYEAYAKAVGLGLGADDPSV